MARTLRLTFEEYPDDEIVLRLSPVPMTVFFDIVERFDRAQAGTLADKLDLFRSFGDAGLVESWSYPEPTNGDGLLARDFGLAIQIVSQWLEGVGQVPRPLPPSASGGTLSTPEASPRP